MLSKYNNPQRMVCFLLPGGQSLLLAPPCLQQIQAKYLPLFLAGMQESRCFYQSEEGKLYLGVSIHPAFAQAASQQMQAKNSLLLQVKDAGWLVQSPCCGSRARGIRLILGAYSIPLPLDLPGGDSSNTIFLLP